jgi:hypothetical protein
MTYMTDFDRGKLQTRLLVRHNAPTSTKQQLSDSNKNLVLGPKWGLIPRLIGRQAVSRNVTLTLTVTLICELVRQLEAS